MRQLLAALLAVPIAGLEIAGRALGRRSMLTQLVVAGLAVALVVTGMLFVLPTRQIDARAPRPYDPATPTVAPDTIADKLAVDAPFVLRFTKPMNQGSVAEAISIKPATSVRLVWDSTAKTLSITPATYWTPFTTYSLGIAGTAMDQSGMALGESVSTGFATGELTSGKITASVTVAGQVAPSSNFVLTFSRPVKLATVQARLSFSPPVTGTVSGDDPTDQTSQVFTFTPVDGLDGGTTYTISFDANNATDAAGVALLPVEPLTITTMEAPQVVRFRPADGHTTADPNQVISVRFTVPMDRKSTAAAFGVYVNGKRVSGAVGWAENDTVLVLDPSSKFAVGSTVTMKVAGTARSKGGQRVGKSVTASFRVVKPYVYRVPWLGGTEANAPWHASELYYLELMNCTRTGGWVTSSGACSSVTHHVMEAQGRLRYNAGVARVARQYSKMLAQRGALTHYLDGTTPHQRMAAAGYPGAAWGENLASPRNSGQSGMIAVEIYFQNEYRCRTGRCEFAHYYNIMNPHFHQAGVGIWVANGHCRVTVEFYG